MLEEATWPRSGHAARRDTETGPHRKRALERGDVPILCDEKEIADLVKMRVGADLLFESLDVRE